MATSLIRSRATVTGVKDRFTWNEIRDGAVLQEDGVIVAVGTYEDLHARHPTVPVIGNGREVLLMDEPFAALDVQTRARMQNFLLDVWRDSGASVLFVTHHIDEAVALADRVVVFTARPGRIKSIFPIDLPRPRNLFSREAEAMRIQLTDLLRDEVDRAFAEQEALAVTA